VSSAIEIVWPDIGDMQRRVTIKRWTDTANAGFGVDQVVDIGIKRWSRFEPITGVGYWGVKQTGEEVTHKIWLKWGTGTKPADITVQHVIDYPAGNRRFRVVRATNAGDAQRFTCVECKELGQLV